MRCISSLPAHSPATTNTSTSKPVMARQVSGATRGAQRPFRMHLHQSLSWLFWGVRERLISCARCDRHLPIERSAADRNYCALLHYVVEAEALQFWMLTGVALQALGITRFRLPPTSNVSPQNLKFFPSISDGMQFFRSASMVHRKVAQPLLYRCFHRPNAILHF